VAKKDLTKHVLDTVEKMVRESVKIEFTVCACLSPSPYCTMLITNKLTGQGPRGDPRGGEGRDEERDPQGSDGRTSCGAARGTPRRRLPPKPSSTIFLRWRRQEARSKATGLILATTSYITVLRNDVHTDRRPTRARVLSTYILSFILHSVALGV
jgi:hypothetical protein